MASFRTITPFDLFGKGKYVYTFRQYCEEDRDLELRDGGIRIFLNTKGNNEEEVSRKLIDFLHYVESADGMFAVQTGSKRIQKIHECVNRIKSSEEMACCSASRSRKQKGHSSFAERASISGIVVIFSFIVSGPFCH